MKSNPPTWAIRTKADEKALTEGYYWDQAAADRVGRFAEAYVIPKYTSGEFRLFKWQRRYLQTLYGWRRPDGGRRFKLSILHVPKKNGKTLLVSVICEYELFARVQPSPLVVSASTSRENAKQVYEQIRAAVNTNAKLKKIARCTDYTKNVKVPSLDAEYKSLSADAPTAEGLNCSCVIVDEAHAHRSQKLYRTLEFATIGRPEGLMVIISTAGDDLTHWYYSLVERGRRIVAGEDLDPTTYAEIYEPSAEDDLENPATWKKVNPSLDEYEGFTSERFGLDLAKAKPVTSDWLSFKRYRLNVFCRPEDQSWIDLARWDQCLRVPLESDLVKYPLYLGFDASQRIDPTSLAGVWALPDGHRFVRAWAWVAEDGVREREKTNLVKYTQFQAEGSMVITEGNVIEKEAVKVKILSLRTLGHQIQAMVMDPNGAWIFGTEIAGEGIEVYRQPQSFKFFNEPTKQFEKDVAAGLVHHDGNSYLRHCINSVRLATDDFDNCRPIRKKSVDKIDGAVALLMGYGQLLQSAATPLPSKSVYETRGPLVF